MFMLLAQASNNTLENLFQNVVGMFSQPDTLAQPVPLVQHLQSLSVVWAVVFLIVGTLCLFSGYKFYKAATVCIALFIGMFSGYCLGQKIGAPFVVAGCLGMLLAVCALPLMKYAVAVFGGLAGAFIGANLWSGVTYAMHQGTQTVPPAGAYWVGALIGLLVCGMLAFILFELSIVLFTSVSGATIAVLGALALLLSVEGLRPSVAEGLTASQLVVPLLVFVPAVIGLILQETSSIGAGQAKAKPAKA